MKKFTFLFLLIIPFFGISQDIVYNFDTDTEGFTGSGVTLSNDGAGHLVITGTLGDGDDWGNFGGAVGPEQAPTLSESKYTFVVLETENSTNFTTWQVINHNIGATGIGAGTKTDFNMPSVTLGSGYTTFIVAIPSNSGNIDRISVRAKGAVTSGALKIDSFRLLDATPTFSGFVKNPDFEDNKALLADWASSDVAKATATLSLDANVGDQSVKMDIVSTFTGNVLLQNTNTLPLAAPTTSATGDEVVITWDMKSTSLALNAAPRFKMDIDGAGDQAFFAAAKTVAAVNTWEPFTVTKSLAVGGNFGATYTNIKDLAFAITSSVADDDVFIDNVTATVTIGGVTLSIKGVDFKDDAAFTLYPNPVQDVLNIRSLDASVSSVSIYNITGKLVLQSNKINDGRINVSQLTSGLYVVRLEDANNNFSIKKLVVSK